VRDVQDTHAELAAEIGEQRQDFGLRDDVQRTGGFVSQQEKWTVDRGHRDQHALCLPDAELGRIALQEVGLCGQADVFESFPHGGAAVAS